MARPFRRSSSSSSFGPRGRLLSRRRVGGVIWPAPINKTFAAVTAGRSADTRRVTRVSCLHTLSVYTCFQFVATEIRDDRRPLLAIVLQLNRHAPRSTVNDANRLRGHGEFLVIYRAEFRTGVFVLHTRVTGITLQIAANTLREFWEQLVVRWNR